jgi:ABC-type glutathione transport system ATPase component
LRHRRRICAAAATRAASRDRVRARRHSYTARSDRSRRRRGRYTAELKLSCTTEEKATRVETVLSQVRVASIQTTTPRHFRHRHCLLLVAGRGASQLSLGPCADTVIGGVLARGISGGQAKRVNIALALITQVC